MSEKHVLPNGEVFYGSLSHAVRVANALGFSSYINKSVYHFSETKNEYVLISEMSTNYIANVLANLTRKAVEKANVAIGGGWGAGNRTEINVSMLTQLNDEHYVALMEEYKKRAF